MRWKRLLAALAIASAFGLVVSLLLALRHSLERERALERGRVFPRLRVRILNDGAEEMSVPSGRKMLLVLFRPDCWHCESELARLDRVCERIPAERLHCIALSFAPEPQTYAWGRAQGFRRLKIAVSSDLDFAARHQDWLMAVPLVFLIAEDGRIHERRAGERSEAYTLERVREFVR